MFFPKTPVSINLAISGASIIMYELAITLMSENDRWFYELTLPITLVLFGLAALFYLLYRHASSSLVASALYLFIDVAILSVAIECFVDKFMGQPAHIFWSAIVLSVCAVISVALSAILSIKRLRVTVRKRLHF